MLSDEASRKSVLVGRIIKNPYRQELHLQWIIELRFRAAFSNAFGWSLAQVVPEPLFEIFDAVTRKSFLVRCIVQDTCCYRQLLHLQWLNR
ncbi:unnamed protein product [Caenorhabditis auriculariae]|uniref:Uncharacterized protein n=1 Tax=Caenorhabditis auriculariae TaxID=2777116 RepID=A0A8S1H407_9PELO|nr:unnamed protein product [Caenorhabditis auriculariae]